MTYENEVTVETTMCIDELNDLLLKNNFVLQEKFIINDIYYSNKKVNNNYLDILKDCILIRNIIKDNKETKMILYKHKEFDSSFNIIKQGKIKCDINSISDACNLFSAINYNKIISINNKSSIYSNGKYEIAVQEVNDKHIYIEVEESNDYKIDDIKKIFNEYNIKLKSDNYFVLKAENEMKEIYK